MYKIYCDGAYSSSRNCSGSAAIILKDDKLYKTLYIGHNNGTNNRAELFALIMALSYFTEPITCEIYSDSQYVVNSINQFWVYTWLKHPDCDKKNLDLWRQLVPLLDFHDVSLYWVKGHNGNKYNEMADMFAQHACVCLNLPDDVKEHTV